MSIPLSVLIIGFTGGRGHLYAQSVTKRDGLNFEGVVRGRREPDLSEFSRKPEVFADLTGALQARKWDVAIVSVPHAFHDSITRTLIDYGVRLIVKEKPLAVSYADAKEYQTLIKDRDITIVTTTQRMVQPSFLKGLDMLPKIGEIRHFEYLYHFALPQMTSGWRANKELTIGGALLDMGYHALDVLHLYFGSMTQAKGELSYAYKEMAEKQLEDKSEVELSFGNVKGHLSIDRHASRKQEVFKIEGSKGSLEISWAEVIHYDSLGNELERFTPPAFGKLEQINLLLDRCLKPEYAKWRQEAFQRNIDTVAAIERIYEKS